MMKLAFKVAVIVLTAGEDCGCGGPVIVSSGEWFCRSTTLSEFISGSNTPILGGLYSNKI
ncbi:hypothetical protein LguiA_014199 [Lonicera macranthoides]